VSAISRGGNASEVPTPRNPLSPLNTTASPTTHKTLRLNANLLAQPVPLLTTCSHGPSARFPLNRNHPSHRRNLRLPHHLAPPTSDLPLLPLPTYPAPIHTAWLLPAQRSRNRHTSTHSLCWVNRRRGLGPLRRPLGRPLGRPHPDDQEDDEEDYDEEEQ